MRYFIRSLKTFVWFLLIFVIIVAIVVLTGMSEFNIETMFRNGYNSLWQIMALLLAIAAVYPKVSYARLFPKVNGNLSGLRVQIIALMQEFGYEVEKESVGVMTFRLKSGAARFSRRYEERITIEQTENGLSLEGLRKDIVRIISRMEYRLGNR